MVDGIGDELYLSRILLEGPDKGGLFLGLFRDLVVATEISTEADFEKNKGALLLVERSLVEGGDI